MMVMMWLLLDFWLKFMIALLKKKRYDFGRGSDLQNKSKEIEEKSWFIPTKNRFPNCTRVLTRKPSCEDCIELNDGFRRGLTVMTEARVKSFC